MSNEQERAIWGEIEEQPATEGALRIAWLEATARAWNREPTPFEWGGKRQA